MASKYTKTDWNDQDPKTPINAANLNKMEVGIEDAHIDATANYEFGLQNAADITQNTNDILQNAADSTAYTDAQDVVTLAAAGVDATAYTDNAIANNVPVWTEFTPAVGNSYALDLSAATLDQQILWTSDATGTLTLPSTPFAGQKIVLIDANAWAEGSLWGDVAGNDPVVIAAGNIEGSANDILIDDSNYTRIEFVWTNSSRGWAIFKIG